MLLLPAGQPIDALEPLAAHQAPVVWKVREGPVGPRWRVAWPEFWFDPIASLCALSALTGEAAMVLGQAPFGWTVDVAAGGEHTAGWGRQPQLGHAAQALQIPPALLRRSRLRVGKRAAALLDALGLPDCPLTYQDAEGARAHRFEVALGF